MFICFATETATFGSFSILLNAVIAIGLLVMGWFLKWILDHMSEKRLFDHRIRLEKEYGLYSDLWEKLFELRRAVGQLVNPLSSTSAVRHDKHTLDLFNEYQSAVRKGEPFMSPSVFDPAIKIVKIVQHIIHNVGEQQSLEKEPNSEVRVFKRKCPDEENNTALEEIEELFQRVARAIRRRVSP